MAMTLVELEAFSQTKPEKRFLTEEIIKYLAANPGGALPGNVTLQGNTFNGASQLVKTEVDGKLPAIDGSQLTNLPGGGVTNSAAENNVPKTDASGNLIGSGITDNGTSIGIAHGTTGMQIDSVGDLVNMNARHGIHMGDEANSGNRWHFYLDDDAQFCGLGKGNFDGSQSIGMFMVARLLVIGDVDNINTGTKIEINDNVQTVRITNIPEHTDNAAAVTAGLFEGTLYRTGDVLKVVHA